MNSGLPRSASGEPRVQDRHARAGLRLNCRIRGATTEKEVVLGGMGVYGGRQQGACGCITWQPGVVQ